MLSKNIKAVFEASPIPQLAILPHSPDFTIVEVNEAYLRVTNTNESDLIGKPLFEAFPEYPDDPNSGNVVKQVKESLERVIAHKKPQALEVQRYAIPIRGTGKFDRKYWLPSYYPVLNKRGEVEYIIHSTVDVTEKVQAEQKAETDRKKLQQEIQHRKNIQQQFFNEKNLAESLIKSLPGTFYLFDAQGKMLRWNKNLEVITGYTSDEIKYMHPLEFICREHVGTVRKAIDKTLATGKAEVVASLLLKDGRKIPFYFDALAITLDGIDFIIGTGLDISELAKERTERIRLSQILEKSLNEIYIFDAQTLRYIYVNAGARENLGYTFDELKEMTPLDLNPEFTATSFERLVRPLRDMTSNKILFTTEYRRSDGSLYDVEIHLQLIQQDDHRVFVAIAVDISERVQIEAQVQASLKEKEALLNEIHHRVKNNLSIVSGLLNLQAQTARDKRIKAMLAESEGRVHSMGMIHEMLYHQEDFSKIDFGAYIKKLSQHISANYRTPRVSITTEVIADAIYLNISSAIPCALITHELITNAYKHAFKNRKSGKICITLSHIQNSITLVVSDNGTGFHPNKERSTLGLSLIYGLATQIKGTVTSATENGTSFTVTFPAEHLSESAVHDDPDKQMKKWVVN